MSEMKKWRVNGKRAGRYSAVADETVPLDESDRFELWFDDRGDAVNCAAAICRELRPGGSVCVCEEERLLSDGFPSLDAGELVSIVSRTLDGPEEWHVTGLDLRTI